MIVNLTQARVTWEKRASVKLLSKWQVCEKLCWLIIDVGGALAMVGSTILTQVGLGYIRTLADHEPESQPTSSVPPWFLPLGSFLSPALTSLNEGLWHGSVRWNKSSSHLSCFWSKCPITATERETENDARSGGVSVMNMTIVLKEYVFTLYTLWERSNLRNNGSDSRDRMIWGASAGRVTEGWRGYHLAHIGFPWLTYTLEPPWGREKGDLEVNTEDEFIM